CAAHPCCRRHRRRSGTARSPARAPAPRGSALRRPRPPPARLPHHPPDHALRAPPPLAAASGALPRPAQLPLTRGEPIRLSNQFRRPQPPLMTMHIGRDHQLVRLSELEQLIKPLPHPVPISMNNVRHPLGDKLRFHSVIRIILRFLRRRNQPRPP